MPLEFKIEAHLVRRVREDFGGIAYKFTSQNRRGVPDRLVILPGPVIFFVELKSPNGRLSPMQIREHKRMADLGVDVFVCNSIIEVDDLLDSFNETDDPRANGWVSDKGTP